jgi:hypothetical protein
MGIVFTLFAGAMSLSNVYSADAGASPADQSTARGYAIFWLFLAVFGAIMVVVSWLMAHGRLGVERDE